MRMLRWVMGCCCAVSAGLSLDLHAQTAVAPEANLKAAYLYHFIQFTSWRNGTFEAAGTLDICVAAASSLRQAVAALAGKPAQGTLIAVRDYDGAQTGTCHVVVRAPNAPGDGTSLPDNILTVAEAPSALDAVIVLDVQENKVVFSIDQTLATARGLTISSKLLRLARSVK